MIQHTVISCPVENSGGSYNSNQGGGNPTPENDRIVGGHLVTLDLGLGTNVEDLESLTSCNCGKCYVRH
jgi:hypothetical protein